MPNIHHSAIIDRNAQLADDVTVGPYSVIGPKVTIGKGTSVGAHCVIEGRTTIGQFNRIFPRVSLGQEPQDLKYRGEDTTLDIGDYNDIRELTTMHPGTANGGGRTSVGSHNYFMINSHVAHDSLIGSHCLISNNVMLAGHVVIEDHAVISGGVAISHFVTIGKYAFLGGLSGIVNDCLPFCKTDGHPARPRGINRILLQRHKFEEQTIEHLERAYKLIYGKKTPSVATGLEEAEATLGHDDIVMEMVRFIRRATTAPHGRSLEASRHDNKRATPTR